MEETKENPSKFYIVDYNNVGQNGLEGIENLTSKDKIVIFYMGTENNMDISWVEKIRFSKAIMKFRKVSDSDSFEYILSAYAGYIIGIDPDTNVVVVSNNNKYKSLENFYPDEEYDFAFQCSISGAVPEKAIELPVAEEVEEETILNDEIEQAIKHFNLSAENKIFLRDLINKAFQKYPTNKEYRCNHIYKRMNIFDNKATIYYAIQPYI